MGLPAIEKLQNCRKYISIFLEIFLAIVKSVDASANTCSFRNKQRIQLLMPQSEQFRVIGKLLLNHKMFQ